NATRGLPGRSMARQVYTFTFNPARRGHSRLLRAKVAAWILPGARVAVAQWPRSRVRKGVIFGSYVRAQPQGPWHAGRRGCGGDTPVWSDDHACADPLVARYLARRVERSLGPPVPDGVGSSVTSSSGCCAEQRHTEPRGLAQRGDAGDV